MHYIVDHHTDHFHYLDDLKEKKIMKCGSATTLIVEKFFKETEVFKTCDQAEISLLALFSCAPLTLDSLSF